MSWKRSVLLFVSIMMIGVLVGGCFGLPKKPKPPTEPETVVSGTVLAPESVASQAFRMLAEAQSVEGFVPLAGATVQAFSLPDLAPLGNSVTTDADGKYTITGLPKGQRIVIIATKTVGSSTVRLSTFVASVGDETQADIDPVTSLATEVLVAKEKMGFPITEEAWAEAYANAQDVIEELDEIDVTVGGALLQDNMGAGLKDNELNDRIVPPSDEEPGDVAKAKAMVRTVRDAGYSLQRTAESYLAKHAEVLNYEVAPFVNKSGEAMLNLLEAIDLAYELVDSRQAESGSYTYDGSEFELIESWTENTWEIILSDEISITIDITQDAGTSTMVVLLQDANPDAPYVHTAQITHIMDDGDKVVEIEGAYALFLGSDDEIMIEGTATVDSYIPVDDEEFPGALTIEGSLQSATVSFTGTLTVEQAAATASDWYTYVAFAEADGVFQTAEMKLDGVVSLTFLELPEDKAANQQIASVVTYGEFDGTMEDLADAFVLLSGTVATEWLNPLEFDYSKDPGPDNVLQVAISFAGTLTAPGEAPIEAEIEASLTEWSKVSSNVVLERDGQRLSGSVAIQVQPSHVWSMELTDESGIELVFSYSAAGVTGEITKNGTQLAVISEDITGVLIDFVDGTYYSLF